MGALLFALFLILLFVYISVTRKKRKEETDQALDDLFADLKKEANKEFAAIIAKSEEEKKRDLEAMFDSIRERVAAASAPKEKTKESKK